MDGNREKIDFVGIGNERDSRISKQIANTLMIVI